MKDETICIRLSKETKEMLKQRAIEARITLTEFVTRCCTERKIYVINGLEELVRQHKHIGNNLNQLTRLAHEGKVEIVDLNELKAEYEKMNQLLNDLLERKRWR